MPLNQPWYRLLLWFSLGLATAVAGVIICSLPGVEPLLGRTYDAVTNTPLPGVEVTVWPVSLPEGYDPAKYDAESGPDGRFSIEIPAALYPVTLSLRASGYEPKQVVAAGPGNLAVALNRSDTVPPRTVLPSEPEDVGPTTQRP